MNTTRLLRSALFAAGLLGLAAATTATTARAQATRTWVSGVGDDVNPGSRTAPCKTFAGAISKTAAGGEINVIDPGGFGAVTITKAITIDGGGTFASVLSAGTNGIVINAGANDVVTLRNLSINGASNNSLNGIRFIAGKALIIENCVISGTGAAPSVGIDFEPAGVSPVNATLTVTNTLVRNCVGGGILIKPGAGFNAFAVLDHVSATQNQFGVRVEDRTRVTLRNSTTANNAANGVLVFTSAAGAEVVLDDCVTANNGTNGVKSEGAGSTVRLSNVTVTGNTTGLSSAAGGVIATFGNNSNAGNGTNGAPTQAVTPRQ